MRMSTDIWIKFYRNGTLTEVLTFSDAEKRIEQKVTLLQSVGLKQHDRVIVRLANSPETAISYLALSSENIIAVPIHPKESESRVEHIIHDSGASAIIDEDGITIIPKTREIVGNDMGDINTIIYTSGTTGQPKGVCLRWSNWCNNAEALISHHKLGPDVVFASPLLLSHCNAHGLAMIATYLSKTRWILFDGIPENFLRIVSDERSDIISVVPTILHRLFQSNPKWEPHANLRYILTAAAPLDAALLRSVFDHWHVRFIQGYGLSESTNFSCTVPVDLNDTDYLGVMFPHPSIGIALEGVDVKIDGGDIENKIGELLVRSKNNCAGYWGKEKNVQEWLATGDRGLYKIFNGQRFYYLKGRIKELINRGGEKISPIELEYELRTLSIPGDFAVIAIFDQVHGEEVGLVCTESFDFRVLEKIPRYRRPKKVFLIDKMPYTATGKLQRVKLSEYCSSDHAKYFSTI